MLEPAILYRSEIQTNMQKYFYTMDMFYETGCMDNWCPNIKEEPDGSDIQYAITDNGKLIGVLMYYIDWYSSSASRFGLFSFDRGNILIGKDVLEELEKLVARFHRVEWRMIGGNPVERSYDRFCKKHNGTKHILKDAIKDREGKYHDDVIYEIIREEKKNETNS